MAHGARHQFIKPGIVCASNDLLYGVMNFVYYTRIFVRQFKFIFKYIMSLDSDRV